MPRRILTPFVQAEEAKIVQKVCTEENARFALEQAVDVLQIDNFTQLEYALTLFDKAITNLKGLPVDSDPVLCNIDLERCLVSYDASQQKFNVKPQY